MGLVVVERLLRSQIVARPSIVGQVRHLRRATQSARKLSRRRGERRGGTPSQNHLTQSELPSRCPSLCVFSMPTCLAIRQSSSLSSPSYRSDWSMMKTDVYGFLTVTLGIKI